MSFDQRVSSMNSLLKISVVIIVFLPFICQCAETIINIIFEDINVEYVNPEYIDEDTFELSVNYINKTYNTLKCRIVVIKEFPSDLRVTCKIFAYAFGDYRIPLAFDINTSTCEIKNKKIFMAPFIQAIGGDLEKCVPALGEYKNDSFYPVDHSVLPSVFPKNKYRMEIEVKNTELSIISGQVFVEIK